MSAKAIWHSALTGTKLAHALRQPGHWSRLHITLLGLLVLFQIADLVTFSMAIGALGLGAEQNPLARAIYTGAG